MTASLFVYERTCGMGGDAGILDRRAHLVVEYKYDAWGKIIARTGSLVSTLGYLNPFRYRGYVYDEETGLYYLRSRYYNPEWGRFNFAREVAYLASKGVSYSIFYK